MTCMLCLLPNTADRFHTHNHIRIVVLAPRLSMASFGDRTRLYDCSTIVKIFYRQDLQIIFVRAWEPYKDTEKLLLAPELLWRLDVLVYG